MARALAGHQKGRAALPDLMAAASAADPPPSLLGAGVRTPARRPAIPWIVACESCLLQHCSHKDGAAPASMVMA